MVTIGIDQLLSTCAMYEHICLEKTKKLYPSTGKFDYQLQFRAIIEAAMVSTPKIFTDNSPISPGTPMIVKKCSAKKSLYRFTEVFDVKKKTAIQRIGVAKSKCK